MSSRVLWVGVVIVTLGVSHMATAAVYCHDFTSLRDLNVNNSAQLRIGPGLGGKLGPALSILNSGPLHYPNSGGRLTPATTLPNDISVVFRLYVDQHFSGEFQGVIVAPPGEGLVIRDDGTFGASVGDASFGTPWLAQTWYTIALVLLPNGHIDVYIKEGAGAVLSGADRVGDMIPASSDRPMTYTDFLTFGGDVYVGDYTVNAGVDLATSTTCTQNNDACANAITITSGVYAGTTSFASNDGSASCGNSAASPDVWYKWVATCDGQAKVSICSADFNTVLSMHTACPGTAGNELASGCSDDCGGDPCTGPGSCLTTAVSAGTPYWIRVAGNGGETGTFELRIACRGAGSYFEDFNDDISGWDGDGAYWSATGGIDDSGYKGGWRNGYAPYQVPANPPASTDLLGNMKARFGDYIHFSYYLKDILGSYSADPQFYVFAPNGNIWGLPIGPLDLSDWTNVDFTIDTNWSDEEARAAGWYNDAWNGGSFASVWQNVTYYNFLTGSGSGRVETGIDNVLVESVSQIIPPNDNCDKAPALTDGTTIGNTTSATPDGTASCGNSASSPDVWYRYITSCNGTLDIDTCGSSYDTVLSLYTGDCASPTEVDCNDNCGGNPCAGPSSCLTRQVTRGEEYLIRVSGANGAAGKFQLHVGCTAPPPPNDLCGSAQVITGGPVSGTTEGGSSDGDASCGNTGLSADVWYAYTATCSEFLLIDTTAATWMTPVVSVHSGCPGNLGNELACNPLGVGSQLQLAVTTGQTCYIRVAGSGGETGDFTLNVDCGTPPVPPTCPYIASFDQGMEGWQGDGAYWGNTGGQDGGGYYGGLRSAAGPYLLPPADSVLYGDLPATFNSNVLKFSYYLKSISGAPASGGLVYLFADTDATAGWDTLWLWTPDDDSVPTDWKLYEWTVDMSDQNNSTGGTWTLASGSGTWADSWRNVVYWNFWTTGGSNVNNGIDSVRVEPPGGCVGACPDPFADRDRDGDVDMVDFADFQRCLTAAGPVAEGCECFDYAPGGQGNGVIDGFDLTAFVTCSSGPAVEADPACDD